MRLRRRVLLAAALAAYVGLLLPAGSPARSDERGTAGKGSVFGRVTVSGAPVPAQVQVRLRQSVDADVRAAIYKAGPIVRRLAGPPLDGAVIATVQTGEDGEYVVTGLPVGRYDVTATGADGHWGGAHVPLEVDGQRRQADLKLRPATESLEGRIAYADGRPFTGLVLVEQGKLPDSLHSEVTPLYERVAQPDAEGRFKVKGLGPGRAVVVMLEVGRACMDARPIRLPAARPFEWILDEGAHVVVGRVVDAQTGKGIPGAELVWSGGWSGFQAAFGRVQADEDGGYEIVMRRAGTFWLRYLHVHAPGYGRRTVKDARPETFKRIALRPGARLVGRVTTAEGEPVEGVAVHVQGLHPTEPPVRHTDAEGRYVHEDLPWGEAHVYARGGGWVPQGLEGRETFPDPPEWKTPQPHLWDLQPGVTTVADFVVERGVTAVGRVVGADGEPVVGASVFVRSDRNRDPLLDRSGSGLSPVAATDEEGRFRYEGLLPQGDYQFEVHSSGYAVAKAAGLVALRGRDLEVSFEAAETDAEAPRGLSTPCWIDLLVVEEGSEEPIEGAWVQAGMTTGPGRSEAHELTWKTDAAGRARLGPFPPVPVNLNVSADDHLGGNNTHAGVPTPGGSAFKLTLERAVTIRGCVLLPDGSPAPGGHVRSHRAGPSVWTQHTGRHRVRRDGTFKVYRVRELDYELEAHYADDVRAYRAVATARGGSSDVELRLAPVEGSEADVEEERGRLTLRLVDPDGNPVTKADVRVGWNAAVPDAGGLFRFPKKVDPDHALYVREACAEDGRPLPLGPYRKEPVGRSRGLLKVVLPWEHPLVGIVRDSNGVGVGRVKVTARTEPRTLGGSVSSTAFTDTDGHFKLGRLGKEAYRLEVEPPPSVVAPLIPLVVEPGEPVEITLGASVSVTVRLVDSHGEPISGRAVHACLWDRTFYRRTGYEWEPHLVAGGETDEEGAVRLEGLDPKRTYQLQEADPEKHASWAEPLDRYWRPKDGVHVIERPGSATVRGRARLPAGTEGCDAHLLYRVPGGQWMRDQADWQDGTFELTKLPKGPVEVVPVWHLMSCPDAGASPVKTRTGVEDLELDCLEGGILTTRFMGLPDDIEWADTMAILIPEDPANLKAVRRDIHSLTESHVWRGLMPDATYTLWVEPRGAKGYTAWVSGLKAGEEVVEVRLAPGGVLELQVEAPGPVQHVCTVARGPHEGMTVELPTLDSASEVIWPLPEYATPQLLVVPGLTEDDWRITVEAYLNGSPVRGEVTARPGTKAVVRLAVP